MNLIKEYKAAVSCLNESIDRQEYVTAFLIGAAICIGVVALYTAKLFIDVGLWCAYRTEKARMKRDAKQKSNKTKKTK